MARMLDRATLAQTAKEAAGGGLLVSLTATGPDGLQWHANVAGRHGRSLVVLDLALGMAEVHPARRRGMRRRGSPGCTMPGCPPRTRRPV